MNHFCTFCHYEYNEVFLAVLIDAPLITRESHAFVEIDVC